MEKDILLLESPQEKARYIADLLMTRSHLVSESGINPEHDPESQIALEIAETPWDNVSVEDVKEAMDEVCNQVRRREIDDLIACIYEKLNRDFGVRYPNADRDDELVLADLDEDELELAMDFDEILGFCRTANRGDRCRFLSLDEDDPITDCVLQSRLEAAGIRASVLPQELANCFIVVVIETRLSKLIG